MLTKTPLRIDPPVGASFNPAHPLALGLAGCWLLNEGASGTVHDASGRRHDGTFSGGPTWSQGPSGRTVEFDGADDWITMGDCLDLGTDDIAVLALVKYSAASQPDVWGGSHYGAIAGKGYLTSGKGYGLLVDSSNKVSWQVRNGSSLFTVASNAALNDGSWHLAIGVCDRNDSAGVRLYIDGVQQSATADATTFDGIDLSGTRAFAIGSRQDESAGTWFWDFLGSVAMVCVWKRVLTEAEIRKLRQNPFELFALRRSIAVLTPPAGGVVQCAGSIAAAASLTGDLSETSVTRLSGTVSGCSTLHAALRVTSPETAVNLVPQTETAWWREVLLNGATHTAFLLGTSLTQGWFWVRRNGGTAVYRGAGPTQVDFGRILYVAERDARAISLPAYLSHPPGSTHYYLVRRFNSCGCQEKTIAAAAVVRIASDGQRAPARPNAVLGLWSEQTGAASARLVWFYCPLDQEIAPGQFYLYSTDASGEADFANPIAVIRYDGRRFYGWHGLVPTDTQNIFIVRAASADGIEGASSACVGPQGAVLPPGSPVILAATSF